MAWQEAASPWPPLSAATATPLSPVKLSAGSSAKDEAKPSNRNLDERVMEASPFHHLKRRIAAIL